jgi:hypothetical protein
MGEGAVTERAGQGKHGPLHARSDAEWRLYKIAHRSQKFPPSPFCGGESAARFGLPLTQVI